MINPGRIYIFTCLIILLAALVVLFSGCKSKDVILKTSFKTNTEIHSNIKDSIAIDLEVNKEESANEKSKGVIDTNINENTSKIVYTTEYDTDKPIDPNTGKHPIKKETTAFINTDIKTDQKKILENEKQQNLSENKSKKIRKLSIDQSKTKLKYSEQSQSEKKAPYTWYEKLLMAFGLIGIGFIGYKIYRLIKR